MKKFTCLLAFVCLTMFSTQAQARDGRLLRGVWNILPAVQIAKAVLGDGQSCSQGTCVQKSAVQKDAVQKDAVQKNTRRRLFRAAR